MLRKRILHSCARPVYSAAGFSFGIYMPRNLRVLWGEDLRAHLAAMKLAKKSEFEEYALLDPEFDGLVDIYNTADERDIRMADAA